MDVERSAASAGICPQRYSRAFCLSTPTVAISKLNTLSKEKEEEYLQFFFFFVFFLDIIIIRACFCHSVDPVTCLKASGPTGT